LLPFVPQPEPHFHDEFAYLLTADTFAHGHLAASALAPPAAFESPQILVNPVYASKYPPGQGLALAIGEVVFGKPYAGVLLSTAAFIFLLCWAARAWLPPQWALIAGIIAWVLLFLGNYWSESYWGGSVAACGGALVFGSLGYTLRERWRWTGVAFGAGAIILYATRPLEGGILCASVAAIFAFLLLRSTENLNAQCCFIQ
jgi:hypothetical protein